MFHADFPIICTFFLEGIRRKSNSCSLRVNYANEKAKKKKIPTTENRANRKQNKLKKQKAKMKYSVFDLLA